MKLALFILIAGLAPFARGEDQKVDAATQAATAKDTAEAPQAIVRDVKQTAPPASKTLSLEDCVSTAIHGATNVLKAQTDDRVSGQQVLQSYMQFLPNLTVQGAYNYAQGKQFLVSSAPTLVDGKSHGPSYGISTTLNIFNGFSDVASWRSAHDREHAADNTLTRAKQQISLDVTQSFLQTVLDKKLVEIAEKNLKASQDREQLIEEQTKVGLRNKSDLFRQQAQTSADEAFLITQQNKRQDDLVLLLRKLRIDPREDYILNEPTTLTSDLGKHVEAGAGVEQDRAIADALDHRADYDVSKLAAHAAHEDVTSSRASLLPKLDFVASYVTSARQFDYQTANGADVLGANNWGSMDDQLRNQGQTVYGLVLTWNIFDRWSDALNVDRAKANAYKADLDTEDFRRQVVGEVHQALTDYNAAVKQLETSERGLVASRKAYEVSEGRYEVGSITFVDLAAAQSALVQAEANRAQALIGYELQKRVVDFAMGLTAVD